MKPEYRSAFAGFSGFSFAAHTSGGVPSRVKATVSRIDAGKTKQAKPRAPQAETMVRAEAA